MKKIILFIVIVFSQTHLHAKTKTIHVKEAGTFYKYIPENERYAISELIISGDLNGSDIKIIREMAGCEHLTKDKYSLRRLDLYNANIVQGGNSYLKFLAETHYSSDNQIGQRMFQSASLHFIRLPKNTLTIDAYAFNVCEHLSEIELPDGLLIIDVSSFSRCSKLESINIPHTVTKIEPFAFSQCSTLKSIALPDNLKSLGAFVFEECRSIKHIKIPTGIDYISPALFSGCINLSKIELHEKISSIYKSAFKNCRKLGQITLPESLISIWDRAFENCTSLNHIYVKANTPPTCYDLSFLGVQKKSCVVHIPKGSLDMYSKSDGWKDLILKEEKDNSTNTSILHRSNTRVWGAKNALFIHIETPAWIKIYSVDGVLKNKKYLSLGVNEIQLPRGVYISIIEGISYKSLVY